MHGNTALVTQRDDGRHDEPTPGTPASMPSAVSGMLLDLDVRGGEHVPDIGTGTDHTSALRARPRLRGDHPLPEGWPGMACRWGTEPASADVVGGFHDPAY